MEKFSALLALCAGNSPVPVNSPHKGQWRGALMFSLICVWINGWVNNREAGDLRRHRGQYDVIVMLCMGVRNGLPVVLLHVIFIKWRCHFRWVYSIMSYWTALKQDPTLYCCNNHFDIVLVKVLIDLIDAIFLSQLKKTSLEKHENSPVWNILYPFDTDSFSMNPLYSMQDHTPYAMCVIVFLSGTFSLLQIERTTLL